MEANVPRTRIVLRFSGWPVRPARSASVTRRVDYASEPSSGSEGLSSASSSEANSSSGSVPSRVHQNGDPCLGLLMKMEVNLKEAELSNRLQKRHRPAVYHPVRGLGEDARRSSHWSQSRTVGPPRQPSSPQLPCYRLGLPRAPSYPKASSAGTPSASTFNRPDTLQGVVGRRPRQGSLGSGSFGRTRS